MFPIAVIAVAGAGYILGAAGYKQVRQPGSTPRDPTTLVELVAPQARNDNAPQIEQNSLRHEVKTFLDELRTESQSAFRHFRHQRLQSMVNELSALGETVVDTATTSSRALRAQIQTVLPGALGNDATRSQQLAEMGLTATTVDEQARDIDRRLALAGVSTALTLGGLWVNPLISLLSAPIIFYLCFGMIRGGIHQLTQERRIGVAVLDAVVSVGVLVMRFFFAGSIFFVLYHFSQKLLLKTQDQSRRSLTNVFGDQPQSAWLSRNGVEVEVAVADLQADDVIVIHAGEVAPVDGIVVAGVASVDQHMLTGESQPVEKIVGAQVFAATIVRSGKLSVQVEKAGAETVAAKIGQMLNQTVDYKSTVETRGQVIADRSATPSLVLSALTWPLLGPSRALAVLLAGFGYNMRIVAPISVLNFLRITSAQGVLVKDGRGLELLTQVDTVVFDKTGTLTLEEPTVAAIHPCPGWSADDVLMYAAAAETRQTHPVARAILQAAQAQGAPTLPIENAHYEIGFGIKVTFGGKTVRVGSERFMHLEGVGLPPAVRERQHAAQAQAVSLVYVAIDEELAGVLELHATIRPEAPAVVADLKRRGLRTVIISGDHEQPTQRLAETLGVDQYFAQTLPERKADLVAQLQQAGCSVCFVGDGINDAIALKKANVSISLRGASTSATDTAQMIMMHGDLMQLPKLFDFAGHLERNLNYGLVATVVPGIICLGGVYLLHFGVLAATMVYNAGLAVSVANAMSPMVQYRQGPSNEAS